ncbi:MAG: hypothetical protein DRJ03_02630 [Chloroflexi bacterium]|nr:MAG: hypothetical protein DRJ03_02630 [Chloroflexota bacterium]
MPVIDLDLDSRGAVRGLDRYDKAVDTSERNTSTAFSKMRTSASGFATVIGVTVVASFVAATAAVVAMSAAIVTAGSKARELENLARITGTTTEEFQNAAFATQKFGVSAEKLADISKDVKDKLGDFIATGGGEFKDFFENIAPKVGLTAKALQDMSGPNALIAVKEAMDAANVSLEEQIFYLESLANDTTMLIPLLEDGGKAFKEQADKARELGIALDEWDIERLIKGQEAIHQMTAAVLALKDKVLANLAPAFVAFGDAVMKAFKDSGKTIDDVAVLIAEKLVKSLGYAVEAVRFLYNGFMGLKLAFQAIIVAVSVLAQGFVKLLTPLKYVLDALVALGTIGGNPIRDLELAMKDFTASAIEGFGDTIEKVTTFNELMDKVKIKADEAAEAVIEGAKESKSAIDDTTAAVGKQGTAITAAQEEVQEAVTKTTNTMIKQARAVAAVNTELKEMTSLAADLGGFDTHKQTMSGSFSAHGGALSDEEWQGLAQWQKDFLVQKGLEGKTSYDYFNNKTGNRFQNSSGYDQGALAGLAKAFSGTGGGGVTNIFNQQISVSDIAAITQSQTTTEARA